MLPIAFYKTGSRRRTDLRPTSVDHPKLRASTPDPGETTAAWTCTF